jgi:hypothetical protein
MTPLINTVTVWAVVLVFIAFAAVVIYRLYNTDLSELICELDATGTKRKASLSRFQLLLFTFIVVGIYLTLCIESGTFVEIPNGVLGLIGISSTSYVLSKTISKKPKSGNTGSGGSAANGGQPGTIGSVAQPAAASGSNQT